MAPVSLRSIWLAVALHAALATRLHCCGCFPAAAEARPERPDTKWWNMRAGYDEGVVRCINITEGLCGCDGELGLTKICKTKQKKPKKTFFRKLIVEYFDEFLLKVIFTSTRFSMKPEPAPLCLLFLMQSSRKQCSLCRASYVCYWRTSCHTRLRRLRQSLV